MLALLLTVWEPISFAVIAAGAFNAVTVRGLPVVLVLAARLATTVLCVAAGRALSERRPGTLKLAGAALVSSAIVQVYAALTPHFPSNRLPGQTTFYVLWTIVYYVGWLVYLLRSKKVAAAFT